MTGAAPSTAASTEPHKLTPGQQDEHQNRISELEWENAELRRELDWERGIAD